MSNSKTVNKILEDTGERMIPEFSKGRVVYGEHLVRYMAIKQYIKDKVVLDIASGSGYGTELIARDAKKCFGVDVDAQAVAYSKKNYQRANVEFLVGDGTSIPIPDNTLDVVVSFETIEHIEDYKMFMSEVSRVLKEDGIFILSTPNDDEYADNNHFHIHEFKLSELKKLVNEYFKYTKMYFQGNWILSGVFEEEELTKEWKAPINISQLAPVDVKKSIYFMAIASQKKLNEKIDKQAVFAEHWSDRENYNKQMPLKKHMDDQAEIIRHLLDENKSLTEASIANKIELEVLRKRSIRIKVKKTLDKYTKK